MIEAAWAVTRIKNTFYSGCYYCIAARRGKKHALIAISCSMPIMVYNILVNNLVYNELGGDYSKTKIEIKRRKYLTAELSKLAMMYR